MGIAIRVNKHKQCNFGVGRTRQTNVITRTHMHTHAHKQTCLGEVLRLTTSVLSPRFSTWSKVIASHFAATAYSFSRNVPSTRGYIRRRAFTVQHCSLMPSWFDVQTSVTSAGRHASDTIAHGQHRDSTYMYRWATDSSSRDPTPDG